MFIKDVESIVGLTKKNIRYYESVGLIKPKRDNNNDYRVYSDIDIKKLKTIKFLREIGVPIREIKLLYDENITIQECMKDRINKIITEEEKLKKIKNMCNEISNSNDLLNIIDVTEYFEEMNILNKEGFTMRDIKTDKSKKILEASISSIIFIAFFIFLSGTITYFQLTETEKIPWILFGFIIMIFLVPIIGIIYNLIIRIKEINKGEEDEASKY